MGHNVTQKIIAEHLVEGQLDTGAEIAIRIDQTLTQDATGTMAYLEFEAMAIPRVKTELSVSYVDHNTLQSGFENADDHRFLQTIAEKKGIYFSKAGNGICHQVHLERFAAPGKTLLGSDSHTPNAGGIGSLAIGAGGLSVAVAMAGGPFNLTMPQVVKVNLTGKLPPYATAKDVIMEVLRRRTVKGGVGKVFEYGGPGVETLSVPERATITNMGAELGATTSIFPADDVTRRFLEAQGRGGDFRTLSADPDAVYDDELTIDLNEIEPLVARPSSPDNVVPAREVRGTKIRQVCVGSCTNSSLADLLTVSAVLEGRTIHPDVSLTLSPGSRQAFIMATRLGAVETMLRAGARILESACGPCIGMGQAPPTDSVTLRTFNRNFPGRTGTKNDKNFLTGPLVAACSAITGEITDPRDFLREPVSVTLPESYEIDDSMIIPPRAGTEDVEVVKGPNIKSLPEMPELPEALSGEVLLKVADNITTDDIMPAGAKVLPLRSNIPAISRHVFERIDPEFARGAEKAGGGFVVGGANYGQGSSREHAALAPRYLGIKAILATGFARIHRDNLINFGILPLVVDEAFYAEIEAGDALELPRVREEIAGNRKVTVINATRKQEIAAEHNLSARQRELILAGGLLSHMSAG